MISLKREERQVPIISACPSLDSCVRRFQSVVISYIVMCNKKQKENAKPLSDGSSFFAVMHENVVSQSCSLCMVP
jgi:hypothetical protein